MYAVLSVTQHCGQSMLVQAAASGQGLQPQGKGCSLRVRAAASGQGLQLQGRGCSLKAGAAVDCSAQCMLTVHKCCLQVRYLECIDIMVRQLICRLHKAAEEGHGQYAICITGDHSTPVLFGDHSHEPVPFTIAHIRHVVRFRPLPCCDNWAWSCDTVCCGT